LDDCRSVRVGECDNRRDPGESGSSLVDEIPVNQAPVLSIDMPVPFERYTRGDAERILLGANASMELTDPDDDSMSSMTIRVTSGCRESEEELFMGTESPTSLQAQWVGETSGGQTAYTLIVTPTAAASQGTGGSTMPVIADWI